MSASSFHGRFFMEVQVLCLCPDSLRDQFSPIVLFCSYSILHLTRLFPGDALILVRLHIFRHVKFVEDESLYSDDPPHALPNLSTDVRLSSSLGSAPGKTCSSSVAPQSGPSHHYHHHSDHLFGK
uniref:hypothetical protein n=1 Tax=Jatropha curcas TaxID=180498 RepID=UPI0027A8C320|nr:hypothetical protein QLP06_mgp008 [Jatropha curcas]WFG81231.1 hypothetical protein [Jatropha curcas]